MATEEFAIRNIQTGRKITVQRVKQYIKIQDQRAETFDRLQTKDGRLVHRNTNGTFQIEGDPITVYEREPVQDSPPGN